MPSGEEQVNEYCGYEPLTGGNHPIDRVSPDISPEQFFLNYIAKRRPAILTGHLTDPEWNAQRWTNAYLKQKAGDADVIVEHRGDAGFGLMAPKVNMKYGDFIAKLVAGDEKLYLTTQDLERFEEDVDDMGMPKSIMAEPLRSLLPEFPQRPAILGKLIPHLLTLWQGLTKDGTTSGLHHDFHDNIYVLMRGRKRFRVFPPSAAPHMHTAGQAVKIYPNGLIVYRIGRENHQVPVRPDGVSKEFLAKEKREEAEVEMEEAEMEIEEVMASDMPEAEKAQVLEKLKERINDCEERMELAMEEMLRYVAAEDADSEGGSEDEEEEDEDDGEPSKKKPKVSSEVRKGVLDQQVEKAIQSGQQQANGKAATRRPCMESYTVVGCQHEDLKSGEIPVDVLQQPDHFCSLSFPTGSDDPDVVFEKCPELKNIGHMICEIKAGEMLYLPASWFHEVTSFCTDSEENTEDAGKDKGHLALNYWMYPPDGKTFDKPYEDDFWQRRWEGVQRAKQLADDEPGDTAS